MNIQSSLLRFYSAHIRNRIPGFIDKSASLLYTRRILIPKIRKYYQGSLNTEKKELIKYLWKHGGALFPFENEYLYHKLKVPIYLCEETLTLYTEFDNKKLFFKKDMSKNIAKKYFRQIAAEGDIRSPHRYVSHKNQMIGVLENNSRGGADRLSLC